MLRQNQQLKISQKISPQQIQFIKLLQVPTASLEQRIKEELEKNPALEDPQMTYEEEAKNEYEDLDKPEEELPKDEPEDAVGQEISIDDYLAQDSYDYRTRLPQGGDDDEDDYEAPIVQPTSLYDSLTDQLHMVNLSEKDRQIGEHIIGNIDEDGYLRGRGNVDPVKAIVNYLAFSMNIMTTYDAVLEVLAKIQNFDPPGVGARDLRECLLLQLVRKEQTPEVELATAVLDRYFEEFTKKHYDKLRSRLGVSEAELSDAIGAIKKLNPKPGEAQATNVNDTIIPDFILTTENDKINIRLNSRNAPDLKLSRNYVNMYKEYRGIEKNKRKASEKETLDFVKARLDAAQWFIEAIRQRQHTLLNTMNTIAEKQEGFFLAGGDDRKLRPMILKDVADEIGMDISTVSRVANKKYVETEFGIYPLRFFFTEGIETEDGMVSNREVKRALKEIIDEESKRKPLSDDKIAAMLKEKGYAIARRTVAKYREQMDIPVARLRKEI
ncbi:RNA polymerase factor sigma-54 [Pontibacter sp. G13]|uniref:RNA polymerase factor sigma-54 n=1 Tax=Pontibacter sp. G13 TaxID=3074898 RepID=UPI00288A2717|nr:RNA polymerase factor sigma-54 [Pontibacter sp. G13]WNJ16579.1 RNA polymerase factor sigma-54 [Pontibacter sp. G13]